MYQGKTKPNSNKSGVNSLTGSSGLPAYASSESGSGADSTVPSQSSNGPNDKTEELSKTDEDSVELPLPEADENGMFAVGNNISAPHDFDRLSLSEYNEALAANGFYYATWTSGTPSSITNNEGDEALLYPLQLYMITYEGTDSEDAGGKAAGWLAQARKNYKVTNERKYTANGRDYVILEYTNKDSSNPYAQGCSAFLTSEDKTAVCAELVCVDAQESGLLVLLESFLDTVR